ncbi:MAG: 2-amino-4-hydroxy-6-hydroxymethyldihydropteridine diphosphokinase [Firmicutes bacterium]|nr:2-amino-4-hydroxy-6-hydroxymethyldihydropteridine diphosphokinase [Bacillota bacterium]
MELAYLSLGSNLGDRQGYLKEAVQIIGTTPGVNIIKVSSVYETEPIGDVPQGNFYNIIVKVKTGLSPHDLLALAQKVEAKLGRQRQLHWGPRTIDVDIIIYSEAQIDEEDLKVPHPEMLNRAFVLVPLVEIEPDIELPGNGFIRAYLDKVAGQGIKKIGSLNLRAV